MPAPCIAGIVLAHILNLVIFYIILKNTYDQQTVVLYYVLATIPMYIIMMYSNFIFTTSPKPSINRFLDSRHDSLHCEKCNMAVSKDELKDAAQELCPVCANKLSYLFDHIIEQMDYTPEKTITAHRGRYIFRYTFFF